LISAALIVAVAAEAWSVEHAGVALAQEAVPEPSVAPPETPADEGGTAPASPPAPTITASGPVAGALLAASGEGHEDWRHGRSSRGAVDTTTYRVSLEAGGRMTGYAWVEFSLDMDLPSLQPGSYSSLRGMNASALAWARVMREVKTPELQWSWDGAALDGGVAAVTIVLTSVTRVSRNTERQGGVTIDSSSFVAHGTIRAVLSCLDSAKPYRSLCGTETFSGTF
jgi:hypothetical protein